MSLDEAQRAKLDLVCRKLQLQPGDTVVEAGCGWGALALHMASHYGVRVKAFNVSREQLAFARERAAREGLDGRVEFIDDDYRNVRGEFDVFVSVGMLEHVGLRHSSSFADVLRRSLRRDGGRGLLHFIGRDAPLPAEPVDPAAHLPRRVHADARGSDDARPRAGRDVGRSTSRICACTTRARWSCGRALRARRRDSVRQTYGDEFARAWELYLAGSQAAFATGWMQLFQVLFTPRESAPPFWTRAELFRRREGRG